jgi:hypothetical protein
LYESQVPDDDTVGFGSNLEWSTPALVNAKCVVDSKGSQSATDVACSLKSGCIVLNAISTPTKAPAESDV